MEKKLRSHWNWTETDSHGTALDDALSKLGHWLAEMQSLSKGRS
jgi:hypothetical protein